MLKNLEKPPNIQRNKLYNRLVFLSGLLYVTSPAPSPHLFGSLGSPGNFKESILPRMEWRRPDLSLVILECKCFGCLKWRVLLALTDSNPDLHVWYGYIIYTHTYTDVPFCFLLKRIDFRPSIQKKRSCQSWFKFQSKRNISI